MLTNFTYNSNGNQTSNVLKSSASNLAIKNETWYTSSTTEGDVTVNAGSYVYKTADEHGNLTYYFYNALKDLVRGFRNVLGVYTAYTYDSNTERLTGVYTFKKDANGNNIYIGSPVTYTYSGSKLNTINYGQDTYSFNYDNFGNVVSTNVGGKVLSTNTYGANNGVLQSTAYGNGAVKNYTYDTFGNLASVGNGSSTQFTWTYDSAMNPMSHVDNVNNLRYNYDYDGIGRLIRQELRSADNATHLGATEFTYDLRNNVTKIANEIGGRTLGQWYYYTSINGVTGSIRCAKENLPVRYAISSSRHVTYGYDSLNRLTQKTLSTDTPLISTYAYKASERDTNTYTTTQISTEHSGKIAYDYTYDVAGNITSIKKADSNGSGNTTTAWNNYRSYTYDDFSQLTSETNATTGKTYTYTYDNVGNITSKSDGESTITYTYGTDSDAGWSKLLTSYNGETIDYDAIGNPTTYRGASLTWNGRQLNSYTEGDTTITYTYDADGLRGSKTVNDTKTTYQYLDGKLYYQETNGNDTYFYYDSYGNITAISYYPDGGSLNYVFVGTNSLGDVNALYNTNGDLIVKYEYDAWGNVIAETDANGNALTGSAATWSQLNPFRYRGYVYDNETGLYYLQSRYYDPEVGRFISTDGQIAGVGGEALGYNTYAYCQNNPVNMSDPTGHWPSWGQVLSAVAVAAIAVAVAVAVVAAAPAVAGVVAATASYYGASVAVAGALATATTIGCTAVAVGVVTTGINRAVETVTGINYGEKILGEETYATIETTVNFAAALITAVPQTVPYPSTGRSEPNNLEEQICMNLTTANPDKGRVIMSSLNDPRMPGWLGWQKYQMYFAGNETQIEIHYVGNKFVPIFFDFKFK